MAKGWRDPVRLPTVWRVILGSGEVVGFTWLSLVFFWVKNDPAKDATLIFWSVAVGIVTVVMAVVQQVVDNWGHPAKPYVDVLLDGLGRDIWDRSPDQLDGTLEQHRLTLFRLRPRAWPIRLGKRALRSLPAGRGADALRRWLPDRCSHKLVPCFRTPTSGRKPRRAFRVHEYHVEFCEGVAGLIYARGRLASDVLPDLHAPPNGPDDRYDLYARLTNDDARTVRAEQYYARRIAGVTIYVGGLRWDALLLDSPDPTAVTEGHLNGPAMTRTLGVLTAMLEEAA